MANKAMWDWMDKAEGKKEGSSWEGANKERKRQGYKPMVEKKAKSEALKRVMKEKATDTGTGGFGRKRLSGRKAYGEYLDKE